MKNILNNVIVAFVALALTFATVSCKKNKNDDPTPNNPSGNVAPTVTATAVPNSATAPATVTITATATDSDGSITKVQFIKGGTVEFEDVSAPYEYILSDLPASNYSYTVKAIDNSGASTTTTVTFTVNASGGVNTAPVFNSTSSTVVSDGSAKTFTLPVSDADGNTVTITNVTGASSNVNVTFSGTSVTVTPTISTYAGVEALTITISDATDNTTSNFTVNFGSSSQIGTYNILNNYLGTRSGLVGSTTVNAGNFVTTGTQPSGGFFNAAAAAGTYNYKILSGGNIVFTVGASTVEYTVQDASGYLVLTKVVSSGTSIYQLN